MSAKTREATGLKRPEPQSAPAGRMADPDWAWAAYAPDAERPWGLRLAGHLFRRAAFGTDWGQLQQALTDGPERTIDKLLTPEADLGAFNRTYDEYEASAAGAGSTNGLRAWWLRRMLYTPHPLLEKMTLFWHNHFATGNARVKSASLMRAHVQLLREHAMGCFEPLLEAISRDPATLVWLGADANRRALPNEGYARQFLAHFSLGPGNFSEDDIREAARAFTGWFVLRNRLRYIAREHDPGTKKVLGQEGNFDGDDVVRIVLEHPAAPQFLVRRLYRWMISETHEPDDALLAPLADAFAEDYDTGKLIERMLRSNLFFSPIAYRQRIKCPVEFALGIVKGFGGTVPTAPLGGDLAALGQDLYNPPTVRGWEGGRYWINSSTLVGRSNLALALVSGSKPYEDKLDPLGVAGKHGHATPESAARFLIDLFLQGDVEPGVAEALLATVAASGDNASQQVRRFAHGVMTLPEFHLA